jgi:UDP-GlcNAc:undecaprenyl-phosphate GlcNAc-1-phosphate transferase
VPQVGPPILDPSIQALPTEEMTFLGSSVTFTILEFMNGYAGVFLMAFLTTLIATPFVRRLAVSMDIIDRPNEARKEHKFPIAYLGGFAVFMGVMAAIGYSYIMVDGPAGLLAPVPFSILLGIVAITFTGLADDVWGWDPRLKIAGQLVAAAALAVEDIGTRVAEGALAPFLGEAGTTLVSIGPVGIDAGDIFYWTGTALIAMFVLGGCNAMNLIDGLDGLCSGTAAIMAASLLALSLVLVTRVVPDEPSQALGGVRIVLCLALLGAVLGFLPWNFNPAVIFLGDCGSLLIGYLLVVVILMLGEQGETHLVLAGLMIFALPIMDTSLAILRRKLAGVSMSQADANHIHHIAKRSLGGVKKAVLALYGVSALFGVFGIILGVLAIDQVIRLRVVYAAAIVAFGGIGAVALKSALRNRWMIQGQGKRELVAEPVAVSTTTAEQHGGTERTVSAVGSNALASSAVPKSALSNSALSDKASHTS